ncbi:MAG: carbamate kinase, partial [Isosphaeraceae bacterium]
FRSWCFRRGTGARVKRTMKTMLIAVGGNSLIRAGEKGTVNEQLANARRTAAAIIGLIRRDYRLVVTHGNGPQVGAALLRSESASNQVPGHTLDVCGAATQGEIGYLLSQALNDELSAAGLRVPVVSVVTQTVVSQDDPAMQHPTKPVGPFYSRDDAEERKRLLGWQIVEDAARGYRRVVPSPEPIEIVELEVIRDLVNNGVLVVACGGGGIPVVRSNGGVKGVEAVIDKDRASALLATQLGADVFAISTDTDYVYLDYKKPTQRPLKLVTASEMEAYYKAGHFPPGNMGPKVESVLRFLGSGGKEAVITTYDHLCDAVDGTAGTRIVSDPGGAGTTTGNSSEVSSGLPTRGRTL